LLNFLFYPPLAALLTCADKTTCRQFLADLAAAQAAGLAWDGRRQTWDFLTLPNSGRFLGGVELIATDLLSLLLYDQHLELVGALSFAERPVSARAMLHGCGAPVGC